MGHINRIIVSAMLLFGDAIVAVLYVRGGLPLMAMATGDGQFTGPFSAPVELLRYVAPVVIGIIALVALLYPVVGAIQEERAVQVRRVQP